jgi:glutathione S-transferase
MASAKPELMYFDGPGRANLTRLAFVAGDVEFTDTRIADWPATKADPTSVPAQCFGCMPCIKHGETLVGQSIATACYAADLGIWSRISTPQERAIDIMVATSNEDLRSAMYKCLFGDDASKAAGCAALPDAAKKILSALERVLERKTVAGPYFVSADGPTLADLAVYDNVVSPFPGLLKLSIDISAS